MFKKMTRVHYVLFIPLFVITIVEVSIYVFQSSNIGTAIVSILDNQVKLYECPINDGMISGYVVLSFACNDSKCAYTGDLPFDIEIILDTDAEIIRLVNPFISSYITDVTNIVASDYLHGIRKVRSTISNIGDDVTGNVYVLVTSSLYSNYRNTISRIVVYTQLYLFYILLLGAVGGLSRARSGQANRTGAIVCRDWVP